MSYAVPLAVFLTITLGAWGLLSAIADRPSSAEERLSRVMNPTATRRRRRDASCGSRTGSRPR